jgi:nucleolin
MSDDLFGSLFEQGKQKKKDKIVAEKKSEKEKVKAEKAKAREKERKKAVAERSSINKKRKNNGEDINPKNKRQKTGSDDNPKKVSVDQLRNEIRNILSGIPVVGEEDIDNLEDINLDGIDVDSDADQVSIGDDDREEFEVPETPKKGKNNHNDVEEEAETEYEDENTYTKAEKTLWMGNVSLEANKMKIIDFFKDCGKINDVRFLTQGQIRDSQVVFLEFKTLQAAKKGLKKQGHIFLGRKIKLRLAGDKPGPANTKNSGGNNKGPVSSSSLFVKNLSFKTTEEHLREIFGECGEIATVRLPTFPDTGKPTGFGFVDFADASGLANALQMNRVDCLGRQLLLEAAAVKNREDKFNKNNNEQAPREAGGYNFGAKVAASPKPNIHMTFGNDKGKPAKKGKKQYEPKKRE